MFPSAYTQSACDFACYLVCLCSQLLKTLWAWPEASVSAGRTPALFTSAYTQSAMDMMVRRNETICRVLPVAHQEGWCLLLPISGASEERAWRVKLKLCQSRFCQTIILADAQCLTPRIHKREVTH